MYNFHLRPPSLYSNENDQAKLTFIDDSNHQLRHLRSDQSLDAIYGTADRTTLRDIYPTFAERREENRRVVERESYEQNSLKFSVHPSSYLNRNCYGGSQNCLFPLQPTNLQSQFEYQSQTLPRIYMRRSVSESRGEDMNVSSLHLNETPLNYVYDSETNNYNAPIVMSNQSDQSQTESDHHHFQQQQHPLTEQRKQQLLFSKNFKNCEYQPAICKPHKSKDPSLTYYAIAQDTPDRTRQNTIASVAAAATTTPTLTTTICGGSDEGIRGRGHLQIPSQIQWPTAIPASSSTYTTTRYCIYEPIKISQPPYTAVVSHALPVLTHNGNLYIPDTNSNSSNNPITNVMATGNLAGSNYPSSLIFEKSSRNSDSGGIILPSGNGSRVNYSTAAKTHVISRSMQSASSPLSTEMPQVFDRDAMERDRRHSHAELFNCDKETMTITSGKVMNSPTTITTSSQMAQEKTIKVVNEGTPV